ncbi:MAG TPA: toprim domain-containing protein [Microlunatus sp.]
MCEGPLDAIAIGQAARHHNQYLIGVASIGTAFTDQHAQRLLAGTSDRPIVLAFDGDQAGQAAGEAAWRKLTEHRPVDVRIVDLPDGIDPAALAATQPGALVAVIRDAQPPATMVAGRQLDEIDVDGNSARELSAFRSLCQYVNRVPIDQRPGFLLDLAQRLHVDPGDAATITAEQNSHILMGQITQRARQLDAMITTTQVRAVERPSPVVGHDHLVRSTAQR